jgi:hypothetical protein
LNVTADWKGEGVIPATMPKTFFVPEKTRFHLPIPLI